MNKFIIHTINRPDREILFKKELSTQGCDDYEIVLGETGNNPIKQISDAHRKAVDLAKERKLLYAIIMENDVKFTSSNSFNRFMELLTEQLPSNWDLFLGGVSGGLIVSGDDPVTTISNFSGFHFYAISRKFYDRFLGADPHTNIDRWCSKQKDGNFYCAYPILAIQYSTYSNNLMKQTDYSKLFGKYQQYK